MPPDTFWIGASTGSGPAPQPHISEEAPVLFQQLHLFTTTVAAVEAIDFELSHMSWTWSNTEISVACLHVGALCCISLVADL